MALTRNSTRNRHNLSAQSMHIPDGTLVNMAESQYQFRVLESSPTHLELVNELGTKLEPSEPFTIIHHQHGYWEQIDQGSFRAVFTSGVNEGTIFNGIWGRNTDPSKNEIIWEIEKSSGTVEQIRKLRTSGN
jgi:hypothetical protein